MAKDGFFSTVVGSFPLSNTKENMERVFKDEINLGIDYPCYPQLISMIEQFLTPLLKDISTLKKTNGSFFLSGDFKVPSTDVALEYGEFIVNFFKENPRLKRLVKGTKACLTGPFTLTSELILKGDIAKGVSSMVFKESRGIMLDWVVEKFAEIMKQIGKAYSDMGINIISMDEPILTLLVGRKVIVHSEDFIIRMLNTALSGIKDLPSIHICGKISPLLRDILLKTKVKIMDHEFRTNEINFKIFEKKHFESTDKFLAMGSVQTNVAPKINGQLNDYVEDLEVLKKFVKKGIDQYGKENLVIKPDCGFGAMKNTFGETLAYEIVMKKLNNMVLAMRTFQ